MNKKILLGSIIAVAILVLVSFTGVVGYQTTKSSTIARASPLFSIRTQRAIDKESKDLTCDYVGKGEESNIPLPKQDYTRYSIQKIIDIISKMDDKSFDRFVDFILKYIYSRDDFQEYQQEEIILTLSKLRSNPSEIAPYILERDNPKLITYKCTLAMGCRPTLTEESSIGECIFLFIIFLFGILEIIFYIILGGITWLLTLRSCY